MTASSKRSFTRIRTWLCCGVLLCCIAACRGFSSSRLTRISPVQQLQQPRSIPVRSSIPRHMSSRGRESTRRRSDALDENGSASDEYDYDEGEPKIPKAPRRQDQSEEPPLSFWNDLSNRFLSTQNRQFKLPPMQVDDPNLLFYDVFLLLNLSVSISFWVVHRLQLEYIALAFNEGCLLSILWIVAGLYHGAFLDSAVDGHQRPYSTNAEQNDEMQPSVERPWWEELTKNSGKGGPSAAGLLALNTFINTISLRLIVALVVAIAEHRPVFEDPLEQLIPLEVGFGLILMSSWRTIHSAFTPRV